MIPAGRLLCEVVNEDLFRWENEGGAVAAEPIPRDPLSLLARRALRDLQRQHHEPDVRLGLLLAINLCEAVAHDIERRHTIRHRLTKHGRHLRSAAEQCRNAIQLLLDRV